MCNETKQYAKLRDLKESYELKMEQRRSLCNSVIIKDPETKEGAWAEHELFASVVWDINHLLKEWVKDK